MWLPYYLQSVFGIILLLPICLNYLLLFPFNFCNSQSSFFSQVDLLLEPYLPNSVIAVWGAGHQSLFICSYTSLGIVRRTLLIVLPPSKVSLHLCLTCLFILRPIYRSLSLI